MDPTINAIPPITKKSYRFLRAVSSAVDALTNVSTMLPVRRVRKGTAAPRTTEQMEQMIISMRSVLVANLNICVKETS